MAEIEKGEPHFRRKEEVSVMSNKKTKENAAIQNQKLKEREMTVRGGGRASLRAVGFGEDGDPVVMDDSLHESFGSF
jgi:hypothetical protein